MTGSTVKTNTRLIALVLFVALVAVPAAAQTSQTPWYRPLSLGDMVDAVGTNPEGMPDELLGEQISTYALHIGGGRGVGVSVRFTSEPDGDVLVAWRRPGALWTWGWVDPEGLGKLEAFRLVGESYVVETHHADKRITSVVLDTDLDTRAVVDGKVESAVLKGTTLTLSVTTGSTRRTLTCAAGVCRP